ncbi:hypothetical protein GCE86_25680 [Micromonospora terminaliae]|uniref:Uncharacterized protein n=1 Tax=Micromonospora terminaliae TaxID=1914461 RepID=A0AAJ2ZGW3_9ACTN|nr:hypothetical protein [Micromonospora terminaliae]NES29698.1 hypothetical protein [Micromonospora terminaliae]QGL50111.1 hypothetical protein GCE86_25680 [Micromonospora terminaliae]
MIEDGKRPSRLSGFRVCLIGGAFFLALLAVLQPITRFEDCPNYGGNGNASAFANPAWDFYLTLLLFGWVFLVVLEQTLSVTRRGRGGVDVALRAAGAITVATVASCGLFVNVVVLCH